MAEELSIEGVTRAGTDEYVGAARIFKALADEKRLRILVILRGGERTATDLFRALNITQPTLAHHMKALCDADLVVGRKEGKWIYYSIDPVGAARAREILDEALAVR